MSRDRATLDDSDQVADEMVIHTVAAVMGKKPKNIKPGEPILSSSTVFDSFLLTELILRLEELFKISIPDEDLDPDSFQSVETLIFYIKSRLSLEKSHA
jgi:acyl carrier protein